MKLKIKWAELEKAGSMGSAEPNFFQILRQICPVFRQIVTKFTKFNKKISKFYKIFTAPEVRDGRTEYCRDI